MPVLLAVLLLLVAAPAAEARWFAAEPHRRRGRAAGRRPRHRGGRRRSSTSRTASAWLSRLGARGWGAPAALSGPNTTEAAVAAGADGRLAAAWIQDGNVVGALVGAPAVPLSSGGGASDLAIEMGVNGVAYAVWTQNGDVRAARLRDAPGRPSRRRSTSTRARAGDRAGGGGGRRRQRARGLEREAGHVFARRIYGTTLSALPQDAGAGDSPQVDIEYDRSYAWVAFRQGTHSVARRPARLDLRGPYALDRGIDSGGPDVSMSSSGVGHGVSVTTTGWLVGAPLRNDVLPARRAGSTARGGVTAAVLATSERDDSAVAWLAGDVVRGRAAARPRAAWAAPAVLARGAVGPLSASSNRIGDMAVAFVAGGSVGVAMYDLPPSAPTLRDLPDVVGRSVLVRWVPGQEFGGRQRYRVLVDGRRAGTTGGTSLRVRLRSGRHRIIVVGVDRRGQRSVAARRQIVTVR